MFNDREFECDRLETIKNKLLKMINENDSLINEYKENIYIAGKSDLNYRFLEFSLFSLFGLLAVLITYPLAASYYNISLKYLPITMLLGSSIIGGVLESVSASIRKREQITNAKTSEERKEEVVKKRIELEKAKNRNVVLKNAYDYVCEKQKAFKYFEGELIETKKESVEALNEKNNILTLQVKEKEEKLDILSTQNVLNFEFLHIRNRVYKLGFDLSTALVIMLFVSVCTAASIVILNPMILFSALPNFVIPTCITTGILSGIIYAGIKSKNNNEDRRIFEKFNKKLGKYRLPKYNENTNEKSKINRRTQENIQELSKMYVELKENEVNLNLAEKELAREELAQMLSANYTTSKIEDNVEEVVFLNDEDVIEYEKGDKTLVKRK